MSTHLFVRSSFSLLDSTIQIPELVEKACEYGYEAVALCDHNVLHGSISFFDYCQKKGIQAIIGMEVDCFYEEQITPFLVLAQDNLGYKNLMKLSSLIHEKENRYCSIEELKEYSQHCILIVYGEGGAFDSALIHSNHEEITNALNKMKQYFQSFYVALSYQETSLWQRINKTLKNICISLNIPTVALNKIYYLNAQDAQAYRIETGIRLQKTVHDQSLVLTNGRYFLTPEEMNQIYEVDDLKRSDEIAKSCHVDLNIEKSDLPEFPIPSSHTAMQYLTTLCLKGLNKRFSNHPSANYFTRLKYELSIIENMHFENYFLIVYDYVKYAKAKGIVVGPGRGSAAGSLVSYCLGITQIDPIKYDLMFERFLNPERISMPDIDVDFQDNRRQEVIDYIYEKYGEDHVANIITFGTLATKQVIRDVGRVLNVTQRDIDLLIRLVNNDQTLKENVKTNKKLQEVLKADEKIAQFVRIAICLEGIQRHSSTHPAGIIMSRRAINDVIPTIRENGGMRTSQYQAEYLERFGLIKMDFLGLRNLSIMDQIVKQIQIDNPSFQINQIPLTDLKTYQLFQQGDTIGVFQFESEQMKRLLKDLKPTKFDEICACLALYRPASKDNRAIYIANKQNPETIQYPSEELEPVLKETYGVMVFQEQVMRTAMIAGGFSIGEADRIRKAITKKKPEEMLAIKDAFINGCIQNHYSEEVAKELFASMEKFDGYGFNKAHAYAYGYLAFQLAYLKANYPGYFYTALLESVIGDETKTAQYVAECRQRNVKIAPPDINQSDAHYFYQKDIIRLPLSCIKNVGMHLAESLVDERKNGTYKDYFDFISRCMLLKIPRKSIETLIQAGALDCFGENRATLLYGLDDALNYGELVRVERNGIQTIDLGLVSRPLLTKIKENTFQKMQNEIALLGFYLGELPIVKEKERLQIHEKTLAEIKQINGYAQAFALIVSVKEHKTKKGEWMAFLKVSDETGEMKLLVMPSLYATEKDKLKEGRYILFSGKTQNYDECIVNRISYY